MEIRDNRRQPQNKPRWRTPVLRHEQVVEVTNGDPTAIGSDGQTTTHGAPQGFTS